MISRDLNVLLRELAEVSFDDFTRMRTKIRVFGAVTEVLSSHYVVEGLSEFVKIGDRVEILGGATPSLAQVIRVGRDRALVKSFDNNAVVGLGAAVQCAGPIEIAPDEEWIGRVLDAFGRPVDDRGELKYGDRYYSVNNAPPNALNRARVEDPVRTGVRVVDCFTPICAGQRRRHIRRLRRRQIDPAVDGRALARFRPRGHMPGWRARPRGARFPR